MRKSHILLITIAVLALIALPLLAGCGTSSTTTTAGPATTVAPGGATTTSAAGGTYDIKTVVAGIKADASLKAALPSKYQNGEIKVASDIPYMPWEGFVNETNQPTGFDYDLSQALAAKLGVKISFNKVQFDSIILGIQGSTYDVSMSDMYDNADRRKVLDFVDYAEDTTSIITITGNPKNITNIESLAGLVVGCEKGTTQQGLLEAQNTKFKAAGKKEMTLKIYPSQSDSLLALQAGTIDCDVTDTSTARYNAETTVNNGQKVFQMAVDSANPDGISPALVGMGILKSNTQLRDTLQKALQSLIDDGTYKTIVDHWGVVAVKSAQVNQGK